MKASGTIDISTLELTIIVGFAVFFVHGLSSLLPENLDLRGGAPGHMSYSCKQARSVIDNVVVVGASNCPLLFEVVHVVATHHLK